MKRYCGRTRVQIVKGIGFSFSEKLRIICVRTRARILSGERERVSLGKVRALAGTLPV